MGSLVLAMLRRVESHLSDAGAPRLFRRSWTPQHPERVLALVHGYAEHSGRYEHVGRWFGARGSAVHAFDLRGHGRSEGLRCHVDRFDDYLDDVDRFLDAVRSDHPELPIVLVGHSMGGLVTATFLAERRPRLLGAALSAPALALSPSLSRARIVASRLLRRVAPRLAIGSGLDPAGLSRDPEVVRGYLEDPLVQRTMTASLAAELLSTLEATAARAFDVQVPVLLMHGEQDPLCPAAGSRAFYEGLHDARSGLRLYPELRHEIFNEPERERVFADLASWVASLGEETSAAASAAGGSG